jgi:hypothetical protein
MAVKAVERATGKYASIKGKEVRFYSGIMSEKS